MISCQTDSLLGPTDFPPAEVKLDLKIGQTLHEMFIACV